MKHRASPRFWRLYRALPQEIQQLADRGYQMLLQDPRHPSLHFKRIGRIWSAQAGLHLRALAAERWIRRWLASSGKPDSMIRR